MIRQCHRCDLRFASEAELNEHLSTDHDADVSVFERYRYPGARAEEPLYGDLSSDLKPMRRYLVVANQTLETDALAEAVRERLVPGESEFFVVVPATHSQDYVAAPEEPAEIAASPDDRGAAQARWRLRRTMESLRRRGVTATGEVGPPDPYEAAGRLLERHSVDEVIMGTLPPAVSRWLSMDVPARIRRRFGVPVTVVTAEAPAAHAEPPT